MVFSIIGQLLTITCMWKIILTWGLLVFYDFYQADIKVGPDCLSQTIVNICRPDRNPWVQSCKLILSDIGQCPTKFGKCPSKSNFDRTLVRSQKKIVTLYIFLMWQNPIANSLNLHFAIKFTRHSSILLNVAPEWLYILASWLIYISCDVYMSDQI
jgi:hypothetical protein